MVNRPDNSFANKPPDTGRSTSRNFIFPHRSVRFSDIGWGRALFAFIVALGISIYMYRNAVIIMKWHTALAIHLAGKLDLPIVGYKEVSVFPGIEPARAPLTSVPKFQEIGMVGRMLWLVCLLGLAILAARFQLLRSFMVLLILLLLTSAIVSSIFERYEFDAGVFGQIWYRQVMLVWILLPWFTSMLFLIFQPNILEGLGWVLLSQAYSFAFSLIRMIFVMGILHYTGLILFPCVWFLVGTLAELIFLLQFFSISIYRATGKQYQGRSAWASSF